MAFPQPYMSLYNASATAIKSVSPRLQVGGPATECLQDIQEFIDRVMGRWAADANTHFGGKSESEIQGKDQQGKKRAAAMVIEKEDPNLTVDNALILLRRSITQRLKSGPNGLMRCWIEFRLRAGSTKEGITEKEFAHGLRCYGIPITKARPGAVLTSSARVEERFQVGVF